MILWLAIIMHINGTKTILQNTNFSIVEFNNCANEWAKMAKFTIKWVAHIETAIQSALFCYDFWHKMYANRLIVAWSLDRTFISDFPAEFNLNNIITNWIYFTLPIEVFSTKMPAEFSWTVWFLVGLCTARLQYTSCTSLFSSSSCMNQPWYVAWFVVALGWSIAALKNELSNVECMHLFRGAQIDCNECWMSLHHRRRRHYHHCHADKLAQRIRLAVWWMAITNTVQFAQTFQISTTLLF